MVFLEPLATLDLQPDDMSSSMLLQFIQEEKITVIEEDAPKFSQADLAIRPAKPTREEGLVYAKHVNQLSPGFKKLYKEEADEVIALAYTFLGHIFSFEHVEFAEQNGEVIATLACLTQEQHQSSIQGGLKNALRSFGGYRFESAFLARFLRYFGPETMNDYYILALFVEEKLRGQGLGSQLLYRAEMRAKEYGYGRLILDVEAENKGAVRLYERRGFTLGAGWPNFPFMSPGVYRMYKVL